MLEELLVEEAKRRAEVFRNLDEHLKTIVEAMEELDEEAEV